MLEIRTMGGLNLREDGEPIRDVGSRKAEALLVYLALEPGEHSRSSLATLMWPESTQDHASASLRVVLSVLRHHVGDYVDIHREAVRFAPDCRVYLDVEDLLTKLAQGRVAEGSALYHGDFLQGFYVHDSTDFEEWVRWQQQRLRRSLIHALHTAAPRAIEAGDHRQGRVLVDRLLQLDPLDEQAHRSHMLLLALEGRRAAALAHYEAYRAALQEELGIGPSNRIQTLRNRIHQGEGLRGQTLHPPRHNLPGPQTSFVGRRAELAAIRDKLRDPRCRLLTLTGPGGSGKTRLALHAVTEVMREFPDGVYFVPLESIYSADYLIPAIADALPFSIDTVATQVNAKRQLLNYLKERSILLLLDGFEHLISSAGVLSEMLAHCPKVQLLAMSRERLSLRGEWVHTVEGLPVPESLEDAPWLASEAVQLFADRAQQTAAGFRLSDANTRDIARICRSVAGIPLGIELAAAWTAVLTCREIADEMEKSLGFLTTALHDVPAKHRSLRAAFDSSWLLLTDEQQRLLSRLSVFSGGFDRQAAAQVAGTGLAELGILMRKSLLRRDDTGRFAMHKLIVEFAAEKLGEQPGELDMVRERHCRHYLGRLDRCEADIVGLDMLRARRDIRQDMENIRAAINWACHHWDPAPIRRALSQLLCFFAIQDWHEGCDAFRDIALVRRDSLTKRGLPAPSTDSIILSSRAHQAFLQTNLGRIDESEAISRELLGALRDQRMQAEVSECVHNLGVNASFRGEYETARQRLEDAVLLGQACDHVMWPTYLLWLGHVCFLLGEYEEGLLSLQKAYDVFDARGTLWGAAFALSKMGLAADGLGEHTEAKRYHRDALSIFERIGNQAGKAYCLSRVSMSAYFLEDYDQAVDCGDEGYRIFEQLGHRWGMWTSLCRMGFGYLGLGKLARARELFGDGLRGSWQDQMAPVCLYALAGLACTLALDGETQRALELLGYVEEHPQMPTPYLQQTTRWVSALSQASAKTEQALGDADRPTEPLEDVVRQLLG